SESSDELLKTPARLAALRKITRELESFKEASWWGAGVDELNAELHGKSGKLTKEERSKLRGGEFNYSLFGDHEVRLVLLNDPCYQVGYNGSVGFLLVKHGGRIYITKILEGYYSRIDNSVGLDSAIVNGERIIEISTGNSMPPATRNYYYVIDPRTHQAVPKKLFKDGKSFTNEMSSALILGEPAELGLPRGSEDTIIMKNNRLLPIFVTYSEDYANEGDGRKLHRDVFRWNGRYYVVAR
ncbi:MAG TPA: hypothetical protein VGN86_14890, partial [Pyrinomonadaceae bacterium]|nr:hypothetical protein [Pyrinomonadaceae bacterium]